MTSRVPVQESRVAARLRELSPAANVEAPDDRAGHAGEFVDCFEEPLKPGQVVGSRARSGVIRGGVDVEGTLSIDNGALRITPLMDAGWGRSALSYGPFRREPGLLFAVAMLNGHNTSQTEPLPEPLRKRLGRWLLGHERGKAAALRRGWHWLLYPRKGYTLGRFRTWWRMAKRPVERMDENLALGWWAREAPNDPTGPGHAFVMRAALGDNGELHAGCFAALPALVRGVQNVPMVYAAMLRDEGAAYYLASLGGAHGAACYPLFRPLALDHRGGEPELYAGLQQAALGQIGFRVDSRVYGTTVRKLDAFAVWYGTAHAADSLAGDGPLDAAAAATGQPWRPLTGSFERRGEGLCPAEGENLALIDPGAPSGLAALVFRPGADARGVGIVVRGDGADHWRAEIRREGSRLVSVAGSGATTVAASDTGWLAGEENSLQVVDDGGLMTVLLNGEAVLTAAAEGCDERRTGVGVWAEGAEDVVLRFFEAHPRTVSLGDIGLDIPAVAQGNAVEVSASLHGPEGEDLAGQATDVGDRRWRRAYGKGRLLTSGMNAARVDASTANPNQGSMAYTVDWGDEQFADIAVDITPPGTGYGEGERGRGGLVLWQDSENFLTVTMYVDDSYDGASIAIFSHLDGFEEIYDAVWSMVSNKLHWGQTSRLRVVSDGEHLTTYIFDEPVLYRAVSDIYRGHRPLSIRRVGIAVNWEWGDDTGTQFANFVARGRDR